MINQIKLGLVILIGVAILGFTPGVSHAVRPHPFSCNSCHKVPANQNPRAMGNLCLGTCHVPVGTATGAGAFSISQASNALLHNGGAGTAAGSQTSHFWGGQSSTQAAAGSQNPPATYYTSRYRISTGLITCTICHDPHTDTVLKPNLLRITDAGDLLCSQCHAPRFISNTPDTNATLTHPIVSNYAAFAADPRFVTNIANVASGNVRLVNGGVSCTSCHSTHYADSSAATGDTAANNVSGGLVAGDGKLLRTDGPLRKNGTIRDGATGTAQLRSNLCKTCHTYKMHGKGGNQQMIGCLDCHGGHSYNNGTPSAYILSDRSPDAVPVRLNQVPNGTASVTFPVVPNGGNSRIIWSDNVKGTANGFCEKCHGDVQDDVPALGVGRIDPDHLVTGTSPCTNCHKHSELFSFANDANAATCGACHGFPPYKNISGLRAAIGDANDGGWADNNIDLPRYGYGTSGYLKDETKSAHKTHAGAKLSTNPGEWYFVGQTGIQNCMPCHGTAAGTPAGNHRINNAETFRNIGFSAITTANGLLSGGSAPVYNTGTFVCTNTYCHSNGGKRNATGTKVLADYKLIATPFWVGAGTDYAIGGYGSIFLQAGAVRCVDCHGNNVATMAVGQKNNSQVHNAHLGGGTMLLTFGCQVCHVGSSASAIALAPNSTDGQKAATGGGKHVNGVVEVEYKTSGGALYTALGINAVGTNYNFTTGTCAIYCHDPNDTGLSTDWDTLGQLACDVCHGGLATDTVKISSGAHARHVTDVNGPSLACDKCHGTNSNTGRHATHVDGIDDFVAVNCTTCHAIDAGETTLVWTNPATGTCESCHTGTLETAANQIGVRAAPAGYDVALTAGHGKTSGTYNALANNPAANKGCNVCHDVNVGGHFDADATDKLLRATATCDSCHGVGALGDATDKDIRQHRGLDCLVCHNPHGSTNIFMVKTTSPNYGGTVAFTTRAGLDGFDEDDGAAGGPGEVNADDLCATCHTVLGGSGHNNLDNTAVTHHQGAVGLDNCLTTCHKPHNDAAGAFGASVSTACNDCHGYPPATGDIRHTAAKIGAHELHSSSASNLGGAEASDCEVCHPGATGYGLTASGTHMDSSLGGATTMTGGMAGGTGTCTNSCHLSTSTVDGYWTDTTKAGYSGNGLNCNACHYAAATPTGANNIAAGTKQLSAVHNEHFNKNKGCSACHDVSFSPTIVAIPGGALGLTHISGGASNGTLAYYQNRAAAALDEASVVRSGMTYSAGVADAAGANNTCSGGIALGCHATGNADWDVVIPNDATGCIVCHTGTSNAAVDPTSGLHGVVPSVSGVTHDNSFGVSGTCNSCHPTLTAQATHINGTFVADGSVAGDRTQMGLFATYVSSGTNNLGTCATTTCHKGFGDDWAHKWMAPASYSSATLSCAGCHGDFSNTWNSGIIHRTTAITLSKHGTGTTYDCKDCHNLEAVSGSTFTFNSNDWLPAGGTSTHGDNQIQVNSNGTTFNTTTGYCTTCHTSGVFNFSDTSWTISSAFGDAIAASACGQCHPGGTSPGSASGAHTKHGAGSAALLDGGAACIDCHGDNGGLGYHNTTAGTHGIGNTVQFANVTYSAARGVLNGTCSTTNCHNRGTPVVQSAAWNVVGLACTSCHYYAATTTATAAGNSTNTSIALSADHGVHFGTGGTFACSDCHVVPAANDTTHINGVTTVTDMSVAVPFEATITAAAKGTGNDQLTVGTATTCANLACHNPSASNYLANWEVTGPGCTLCHGDTVTPPTSGSHVKHMTATGVFGQPAMACTSCHPNNGVNNRHMNGTKLVQVAKNSITTTIPSSLAAGPASGCGTNDCHNNGVSLTLGTGAPGSYTWGTPAGDCTVCHGDATTLASHAHNEHMNNGYGVGAACTDCHLAATVATHINKSINFTGGFTYSRTATVAIGGTPSGTCTTTSCHNRSIASIAWNVATGTVAGTTDLSCTSCHGNGAGAGLSAGHEDHFTAGKTCNQCHAAVSTTVNTTAHISDKSGGLIDGANAALGEGGVDFTEAAAVTDYSYNTGDYSCYSPNPATGLGCHATAGATGIADPTRPYWNISFLSTACANCHTNTSTANINPISGLHGVVPSISGQQHNSTVTGGCIACHNTMPVAATHKNGTFTGDTTANLGLQFYTQSAADTGTCLNTGVNCHGGAAQYRDDWAHKWMAPASYTSATLSCAGCHGDFSNTWNSGIIHRTTAGTNTKHGTGTTYDCKDCHNLEDGAGYIFTFSSNDWLPVGGTSTHGDNQIQVNSTGTNYNSTTGYCTGCHTTGVYNFSDTSWTITPAVGVTITPGACNSCHGYPPVQQTTGAGAPYGTKALVEDYNGGGRAHVVAAHVNPATLADPALNDWTPCLPCHDSATHNTSYGMGNMAAGRQASVGSTNELTRYPRVNLSATYNMGGTAFYNMGATTGAPGMGYCSNVSCHFGETPRWDCDSASKTNDPQ